MFSNCFQELYTRWSQFAVFHSIYSGTVEGFENRPWKYPTSANGYGPQTIQQTILLRHALTAYHYTALHQQAHKAGITVTYPLYFDYPKHEAAYSFSSFELRDDHGTCDTNTFRPTYHQSEECLRLRPKSVGYAWGPSFVVFPVTTWSDNVTGIAQQDVWAPPGNWVHFQSGRTLTGPKVHANESFAPGEVPAYNKADSVVPMQRFGDTATTLSVVLSDSDTSAAAKQSAELYEDDGTSLLYQGGAYRLHAIVHTCDGNGTRTVTVSPVEGRGYAGEPTQREWVVEFRRSAAKLSAPLAVEVNGVALKHSVEKAPPGWWLDYGPNGVDAGHELGRLVVAAGPRAASALHSVTVHGV